MVFKRFQNRIETLTGVDFDGNGSVGVDAAPMFRELAQLKEEQRLLREEIRNRGNDPEVAAQLSPRTAQLIRDRDALLFERRRIMLGQAPPNPQPPPVAPYNPAELEVKIDWDAQPKPAFGKPMREAHFLLDRTHVFLNSASYGATPEVVCNARNQWELVDQQDPLRFRFNILPTRLRQVEALVAQAVGADPANLHLLVNANAATSTVFKSQPWQPGDRLMIFSCDYDATKLAAEYLMITHGVEIVEVDMDLPLSNEEIITKTRDALEKLRVEGNLPRLANFCHVTSKTAWLFPAEELVQIFHSYGIPVCVDGAQAPGHHPINVGRIGADYYLGTVHKWMYSCQGVAFLVTLPFKQAGVVPLTVSYMAGRGHHLEMTNTGPQDYSTWLSVIQAFEFVDRVCGGWDKVRGYCNDLARQAVAYLEQEWGTKCVQENPATYGNMPILPLPKGANATAADGARVMAYLLAKKGITAFCMVEKWKGVPTLCIRVSCQIFTDMDDIRKLGTAVKQLGGNYGNLNIIKEFAPDSIGSMFS
eukprot:TRINITY_DN14412_c0_g1_i1.p1 TRINITY_DN14412_c0_g1~~TRINITY_DN14412_c0_g1_i1.p1  ORF type:complete len:533 (-),score=90.35 TRINITY_DN14412_c0_g1_i1:20-1618(-)